MLGERWGVTDAETRLVHGCDAVLPGAPMQAWRGVTVDAPSDVVWVWVRQLRLAPYAYDWVDNLGRRSPRVRSALPEPAPGDRFMHAMGRDVGTVVAVDPGRELTARIGPSLMSYRVASLPDGRTRLLLKLVSRGPRPLTDLLCLGDLPMARRQLLTLRDLAEAESRSG
ncbi:polyketide cyclase [Aeromicrobium erythreum]|uniref:Polyketide cyclase n=1 Tax=Aeromicrobium erythreum TaxID=2041 RepID=A0A0U4CDW6_9ACTN|nr:polyketide cyclase [Aeromicrobium erythreum]ALX03637.1 polyketide cyclase [Aeromicrobium erythreum]